MNKILKRILIGIGILIGIVLIFAIGFFMKMKSETKQMNVIETKLDADSVYSIKDSFVNLFLIKHNGSYIAIDAGNDLKNIAVELKKVDINPEKVVAVILTHTDKDHVSGLKLFKNAQIYISKAEIPMLTGEKKKIFFITNSIGTDKYLTFDDQQTITINDLKIKGFLTPGHTCGSISYLVDDKYLFVGDAMSLKNGKIGKFNKFFNMDNELALKSIANITNIPDAKYIFTAHYGFTNDYKNAVKDWK